MDDLLSNLRIHISEVIYIKDPESSDLGKRIINGSIKLIDRIGFEDFNFRKLATEIDSTEASVYRYFENKHKLLLYLIAWYWGCMEYRLVFSLANVALPWERLKRAVDLLTGITEPDGIFSQMDMITLKRIVITESSKAYLTKDVDQENKNGVFSGYKRLVERISDIILEINPHYPYPHMLVSTVVESSHHQRFYADHLPKLTDTIKGEDSISCFCWDIVLKSIKYWENSKKNPAKKTIGKYDKAS